MSWKKQILIICPAADGQMYLGILLSRIWYTPVLAKTAEEAVRLARETSFSLILLDGDIGGDGLNDSIDLLMADPVLKNLPLVVFLRNESSPLTDALLARGCSAILTRPLDLSIVYGVLGKLSGQPRSTPRIPANIRVEIEEGTPEKYLTSVNISEGGIFLRTYDLLPEGTKLHIRFTLPHDTEPISIATEVVRTLPLASQLDVEPGLGLRFINLPESDLFKIRNFAQWEMMGDLEWESNF